MGDEVGHEIYATMYKQIQNLVPERLRKEVQNGLFVADRFTDLTGAQRNFFVGILASDCLDHQLPPGFVPAIRRIRSAIAEPLRTADGSCLLQFQVIANGSGKSTSQIGECNFGTEAGLLDVTANFARHIAIKDEVPVCKSRRHK